MRTYSELIKLPTFQERYEYCRIGAKVGDITFGTQRWLNQVFYNSSMWKEFRNKIILRDEGFDLGVWGYQIPDIRRKYSSGTHAEDFYGIIIHHLNPLSEYDITHNAECLVDPENAICVSLATHNAIHYGSINNLPIYNIVERRPGDTKLW